MAFSQKCHSKQPYAKSFERKMEIQGLKGH